MKGRLQCSRFLLVLVVAVVLSQGPASAQDRPVVFVHGFLSSGESWRAAAARLQSRLAIAAETPSLSSRNLYEQQAEQLQSLAGKHDGRVVAVGHSNGGVVARQWSLLRPVTGILTVGTPHRGAPVIANVLTLARYDADLVYTINNLFRVFANGCCNWQWIVSGLGGWWDWMAAMQTYALPQVLSTVGLQAVSPVTPEMIPNSGYMNGLNSPANLAREASAIPARVGVASTAYNFYFGGVLRAAFPDDGDTLYNIREWIRWGLDSYSAYIYATAPIDDAAAFDIAEGMARAAWYLRYMDEYWCRGVSTVGLGACWLNDTIVPQWSQAYPGGVFIDTGWNGPAHTQESRASDSYIEQALTTYASVVPRGTVPPTPPPPPPGGGGEPVTVFEHIDFSGASAEIAATQSYVGGAWNDRVSSVHVPSGRTVVLYQHMDFGGASLELTSDAADLRAYPGPGLDGTWNDAASSIEVR